MKKLRPSRSEAVEEAEAIEEAEAVEGVEDLKKAPAAEGEAVEEAQEVPEADVVEEAAEPLPAEPVEEVEIVEEAQIIETPDATTNGAAAAEEAELVEVSVEDAGFAEDAGPREVAKADELGELESVGEDELAVQAPPLAVTPFPETRAGIRQAPEPAAILHDLEAYDTRIDSPEESLEELESLKEIKPLPPLPYEEGLEYLPAADEEEIEETVIGERGVMLAFGTDDAPPGYFEDRERPAGAVEAEDIEAVATATRLSVSVAGLEEAPAEADVEELEALEEVSAAPEEVAGAVYDGEDAEDEIPGLIAGGTIKAWSLQDLQRIVDESKSAIVMEDGVFRIKDELYAGGTPPARDVSTARNAARQGGLLEIARAVVKNAAEDAREAREEEEALFGGIGDLIREAQTIDLSEEVGDKRDDEREEILSADREKIASMHLKRNGIDYDEFLSLYPRSFTHTSQMKSLVEVSRRVTAVSACLLLKKPDGFLPDLTVGLSEKSAQSLRFAVDGPMCKLLLSQRKAVVVNRNPAEIQYWRALFDFDDLRYMKRIVMLPVTFRNQDAYALLAFAADSDVAISTILTKLIVL